MSEWKEYKLKELCLKIGSGATPTGGGNSYKLSGISLIRSQNVLDLGFSEDGLAYIDEAQANELKNVSVVKNDILLNITGDSVARVCKVPEQFLPARVNQHVTIIRPNPELLDYNFLLYYLQSIKPHLLSISEIGATRRALTKGMIEDLEFIVPNLTEQRSISKILTDLDKKIDLLTCQNKTLEQLAETYFRQWFVDGANDSWVNGKVGDLFTLQRGFDLPEQNRQTGPYPIITASGINAMHNEFKVNAPGVTTGRSGTIGEVFYIDSDFWPLNTSLFVKEYKIGGPLFAYYFLKTMDLAGLNSGSAVPTLNRNDVHAVDTFIPPLECVNQFEESAHSLRRKISSNNKQINDLRTLRDTLLPKLMSGELEIKH